ncbi:MAG: histidine--tRNA ligase [Bacillota bacterium]
MEIKAARGTRDVLPSEAVKWRYLEDQIHRLCREYGYQEIRTPVFEHTELFVRGVGDTTDIVEKEMYTFDDRGGRSLTLRPEGTAPTVRAYLEHGLGHAAQPTKLYYMGPIFRYERPQAGRYRQHTQFGVEVFGASDPAVDAEVICMCIDLYQRLGLRDISVSLNSIGCPVCRPAYRERLIAHYRASMEELCGDCLRRLERNPLRVLDCRREGCRRLAAVAPRSLEHLCPECTGHFTAVKNLLTALGVNYQVDAGIVRGLDYYTKTVFEVYASGIGAQNALNGGGRYDGLVETIGGTPTPGVGFGLGLERLLLVLEDRGCYLPDPPGVDAFLVTLGDRARRAGLELLYRLRKAGVSSDLDYLGRSLKAQMKYAAKLPARWAVVLGDDELERGVAALKDLTRGAQLEVSLDELVEFLADPERKAERR